MEARHQDKVGRAVIRCCQEGWPAYRSDVYITIQSYW